MMLRIAVLFFFISGCLVFPNYYQKWAKPFRFQKVYFQHTFEPAWELSQKPENIEAILSQTFKFLGKGKQSYAFLSEDENYVLKLFIHQSSKIKQGQNLAIYLKDRFRRKPKIRHHVANSPEEVFAANKLSFDLLQPETGLVWVHLNPQKDGLPPIKIIDRKGFSHLVDPSEIRFVIQKKGVRFFPALEKALKQDIASFNRMVRSFSTLLHSYENKGIAIRDSKLPSNFGFLGEQAFQIDVSDNVFDSVLAPLQAAQFRAKVRSWLESRAPEAIGMLDE